MTKVHVVLRKEDIDEMALADRKVAVVFDVLLATSSITAVLAAGARSVIPVRDAEEAKEIALRLPEGSYELVGEYEGRTIVGFHPPAPLFLQTVCPEKTVVLSTTNEKRALYEQSLRELLAWVQEGSLKLMIGGVYPLEQASEVHRLLQGRKTHGKLLLVP
ncbi:putative 2-phosphosulfolactate phosphatase [Geobacillus stearothermophilus]|uniref:2-phosphosulfolactate phosphatase n=1 Tax=Geobacillus TaxID=129337 RepID=UPI0007DFF5AE|nr:MULTISPECIES: 2-phosphosulfolactate phosphatase [Geobacillus]MBR2517541.1 2-phosphosulfolactate phosphatase [Geobacillus sp.]MED3663471.1 2-phosphosulfolactate phosphatase [Geobacillus stearothermophilus]OAO78944.1 putative 2-phosphosulfolactate phosphatase [Geobacillus stearothermophilus]